MGKVNVIIEMTHSKKLENNAFAALESTEVNVSLDIGTAQVLDAVEYDKDFPAVMVPKLSYIDLMESNFFDMTANFEVSAAPQDATFIVRGQVDEEQISKLEKEAEQSRSVVNIFSDTAIQPMIICPGSPASGTDTDVERLLCTAKMHSRGMDGSGVLVAVVDSGVNMSYLNSKGKNPNFDAARSWAWNPAVVTPGSAPVDHGTMCAFDVCIAAPKCTILDIALLRPISAAPGGSLMSGLLSDAIRAYSHLLTIMNAPRRPGDFRSLVVNNSWGMFHPNWDFPVGHPGNYSDNPNHPFNRIVTTLERAGADILFAAGNCGADCPDNRCGGVTTRAIYGANSSDSVMCVAGVDITKNRVGYSAIGPGRLTARKPDISGYTHFKGSGVYGADGGTSAACPVVSGVVAAIRTRKPFNPGDTSTSPSALRNLITSTAQDLGTSGYDFMHGYGVINGCVLADKFPPMRISFCDRFPQLCRPPIDICRRYPWICRDINIPEPIPPIPPIQPVPPASLSGISGQVSGAGGGYEDILNALQSPDISTEEAAFLLGFMVGRENQNTTIASPPAGGEKKEGE